MRHRLLASAIVAIVAVAIGSFLVPTTGSAKSGFALTRLAGTDRYDTARLIAVDTFSSSDIVVLASGTSFPDALAGSYIAGIGDLPILLTTRDAVPQATLDAISALGAQSILIVGGTGAVGQSVEDDLVARGFDVVRVAGPNRYATAQQLAEEPGSPAVGSLDDEKTAIVASGETFPDALAMGGISFARHFPTLLTPRDSLAPETSAALTNLEIKRVLVAGGSGAISDAVASQIAAMGIQVTRLGGANRSETAKVIADFAVDSLGFDDAQVDLASGAGFADALAGGPHAGSALSVILLTAGADDVGDATRAWLAERSATLDGGVIIGGTAAVSAAAEQEAEAAGRDSSGTTTSTRPTTSTTRAGTTTTTRAGTTTTTRAGTTTTTRAGTTTTTRAGTTTTTRAGTTTTTRATTTTTRAGTTTTTRATTTTTRATTTTTRAGTTTTTRATTTTTRATTTTTGSTTTTTQGTTTTTRATTSTTQPGNGCPPGQGPGPPPLCFPLPALMSSAGVTQIPTWGVAFRYGPR